MLITVFMLLFILVYGLLAGYLFFEAARHLVFGRLKRSRSN